MSAKFSFEAIKEGYDHVKLEQLQLIEALVSSSDVFGVLQTGFGKSMRAYQYFLMDCSRS